MLPRYVAVLLEVAVCAPVVCATAGCNERVPPAASEAGWPMDLLGRKLQISTGRFVIYAAVPESANELQVWLEDRLERLRARLDVDSLGAGVVIALEAGGEPDPAVEGLAEQYTYRFRKMIHEGPPRRWKFPPDDLREYTLDREAYFRESFSIPAYTFDALVFPERASVRPTWICFLATDSHQDAAADEAIRAYQQAPKNVPADVRVLSLPAEGLMSGAAQLVFSKCRSLDRELLLLQRREALSNAIVESTVVGQAQRLKHMGAIQDEINASWKAILARKPRS